MIHLLRAAFLSALLVTDGLGQQDTNMVTSIALEAVNLTEDMSTLSSKNDEVLTLVYDFSDSSLNPKPLLKEFATFDSLHRNRQWDFQSENVTLLLMFAIEMDTERSKEQMDLLVKKRYREILHAFANKDLLALQKITGDDDIIGVKTVANLETAQNTSFVFQGRYKLDKFNYKITMKCKH